MNKQHAESQEKKTPSAESSVDVGVLFATLAERLGATEKRIDALEGTVQKKQSANGPQREMTPTQFFKESSPAAPKRYVGPVPFTADGRVVDPSWKLEGGEWIQRDVSGNIIQRAKA